MPLDTRRIQKKFLHRRKQVATLGDATGKTLERNVYRRFARLMNVKRFVLGWVGLVVLLFGVGVVQYRSLSGHYQTVGPVPGGIYTEGIVGSISNTNPIYATSEVDRSLSRLLYAGLMGYNAHGQLRPVLAQSIEAEDNGRRYVVTLRNNAVWHDGKPVTSKDVVFTFNTIKNPNARSGLQTNWQGVQVEARDARTVVFSLPSALATFQQALTLGIIPEHILGKVAPENLRNNDFNTTKPVGTGPFTWRGLQVSGGRANDLEEQVALTPFKLYVHGKPKLNEFIMHTYTSADALSRAFEKGELTAAAGLPAVPEKAAKSTQRNTLRMAAGTYVFFKTTAEPFTSAPVRQALVAGSQPQDIIASLEYAARPVRAPILQSHLGYNKKYDQKTGDVAAAKALLAQDGWAPNAKGILSKNGRLLSFSLLATDTPENRNVAKLLQKQWQQLGVQVTLRLVTSADYALALSAHDYQATLYGIALGDDPDVFAYWDGSQADIRSTNRLNLSEWNNATANAALQAGRTRLDAQLRVIKYEPFFTAWQQDAPALGLYQPGYSYLTTDPLYGLTEASIHAPSDRFNGVEDWQIRTARINRTPVE